MLKYSARAMNKWKTFGLVNDYLATFKPELQITRVVLRYGQCRNYRRANRGTAPDYSYWRYKSILLFLLDIYEKIKSILHK